MAELVMERFTTCPNGKPANVAAFEVVLADDDARAWDDPTPRQTNLARLFTRGNLAVLHGAKRDVLITIARGASRQIALAVRLQLTQFDIDLLPLGVKVNYPRVRGSALPFDYYGGPALGASVPTADTLFDDYKVRARA